MARPKTKAELLAQSQTNFDQLLELVEALSEADRTEPGVNGAWSLKDVLAHLYAWHKMFFIWYEEGMSGGKAEMPAPGYKWSDTPALNEAIYQRHKDEDFAQVLANLKASHTRMMQIVEGHSDEELFTKQRYKWTGSTSVGSYAISAASSHYQWALDLIKKWNKQR